jgi:hypothetical protein
MSLNVQKGDGVASGELVHERTFPAAAQVALPGEIIHVSIPPVPEAEATAAISLPSAFKFGEILRAAVTSDRSMTARNAGA